VAVAEPDDSSSAQDSLGRMLDYREVRAAAPKFGFLLVGVAGNETVIEGGGV
jgi:hypothetical protein